VTDEGLAALIGVLGAIIIIGGGGYALITALRDARENAKRVPTEAAGRATIASSDDAPVVASLPPANVSGAGWNVVVILIGGVIAIIGLFFGLTADVSGSAPRQTVAALWTIEGLIGLLIVAVGILGLTLVRVISHK
jgi:hypothetical protein